MFFGENLNQLAFIAMVAVAVGGVALALLFPLLSGGNVQARMKAIAESKKGGTVSAQKSSAFSRLGEGQKDGRRKQMQETRKQIEACDEQGRKRTTLRRMVMHRGREFACNSS